MEKRIIFSGIVIAISCLMLTSCDWFTKKKQVLSSEYFIGKWELDSIDRSIFNTDGTSEGLLFSKPVFDNQLPLSLEFSADSIYTVYDRLNVKIGNDKFYFDSVLQKIFVREDSTFNSFIPTFLNDSTMQIDFTNSGIHYFLVKQN